MLRIKRETPLSTLFNESVPLKHVRVDAKLNLFVADVTLTQVFQNDESVLVEAVYCFPVEENAAIYAFVARIDDEREIVAELKEKKEAQQVYTQILTEGHGAYLLEQDENSNDIFIVSVGALKPGSQCQITISYVSELDLLHSQTKPTIRFVVPTTVAPRYSPSQGGISSPAGTEARYANVSSPSHPIKIDVSNEDLFLVTFEQQDTALDRDIIIDIELAEVRENSIAAIDNGAAVVSFIPNEQNCQRSSENLINEFLFVIDCSGSMSDDNKIGLARKAMLLFLKSLPINCRFNIIRFGSQFSALFSEQVAREYNEVNMCQAEKMIKNIRADLGGTELLQPLQWLKDNQLAAGCVRQIFLLTDGEVSNVRQITNLCHEMATFTRIFSFGLGSSPSRALIKGLARATNGYFVFIAPNTNVDIYVAEQLARALQPNITDVHVKWNTNQRLLHEMPEHAPPVFVGDRLLFYALLDETMPFDHKTTVELFAGEQQQSLGEARIDQVPLTFNSRTVARLAAKALLREILKAQRAVNIDDVVNLSLKYGILCSYTAFVGLERRLNVDIETNASMQLRKVPIMISKIDEDFNNIRQSTTAVNTISLSQGMTLSSMVDEIKAMNDSIEVRSATFSMTARRKSRSKSIMNSILQPATNFFSSLFSRTSTNDSTTSSASKSEAYSTCRDIDQPRLSSKSSDNQASSIVVSTNEQKLVDHIIELQQYDGLWVLTADDAKQLTNKSLTSFASLAAENIEENVRSSVITTAIIITFLETQCLSMKTLWQALTNKARQRLRDLFAHDDIKLEQLMKDIRDQFQ